MTMVNGDGLEFSFQLKKIKLNFLNPYWKAIISPHRNPLNYFEKRKKCLRRKDNADTVAIGKRIYKNCMEGN